MNLEMLRLPEPLFNLIRGLESGGITNFFGGPGTGKTNVCLISTLECIKKGGIVVYIDSEGGFSAERVKQLAGLKAEDAFNKIKLLEPKTFQEQAKIIRELKNIETDLIVLDSAVALYRLEYSDPKIEILEANRELSKQLALLSTFARESGIPVLITAHTFKNWDTGENDIVGGDSIKYWSKSMVFLEKTSKMGERKATVVKHRSIPEGKETKFLIVEDGIKPSRFSLF